MKFGESAKASWELSYIVPVELCKIEDKTKGQKPEDTQVHHSLKVPKWLEMRLNKGMLGQIVKHLECLSNKFQFVVSCGLHHNGFKARGHHARVYI